MNSEFFRKFLTKWGLVRKKQMVKHESHEDFNTIAWIFLAIKYASEESPCKIRGISNIADGINKAVPTQKELQTSIKWLLKKELIIKDSKKYSLSEKGKGMFKTKKIIARKNIYEIWDILETQLSTLE